MSKSAFLFPGQGSQSVGMLADVAEVFDQVHTTFEQASDALGYDLWHLVQHDTNQQLNQTQITQPALLTASVALFRIIQQSSLRPDYMAGHSLGEYSALVCAGVLSLEDGVKLVEARGQFMQQAVPAGAGAMYAIIGLDDKAIRQACNEAQQQSGQIVAAVNYNSPGQVVIAGTTDAAALAAEKCQAAGAKRALPLSVSVPSHCELMLPAAEKLAAVLDNTRFSAPSIPVVNNVDVAMPDSPEQIKDALLRQLSQPVQWTQSIELLVSLGVENGYEVGPGKVLSGLTKRINKAVTCSALNSVAALQQLLDQ